MSSRSVIYAVMVALLAFSATAENAWAKTVVIYGDDAASDADGCGGGPAPADDPCNTIQRGIDVASAGDTVEIRTSSHRYSESVHVSKPDLTLRGPMAGVAGYERAAPPALATEAVLDGPDDTGCCPDYNLEPAALAIEAPGVTVDGLAIADTFSSAGIAVKAGDAHIENCVIARNGPGLWIHANGAVISHNYFFENGTLDYDEQVQYDIYGGGDFGEDPQPVANGLTIEDNLFDGSVAAVALGRGPAGNTDVIFDDNSVFDKSGAYTPEGVGLGKVIGGDVIGNQFDTSRLEAFDTQGLLIAANDMNRTDLLIGRQDTFTKDLSIIGNDIFGSIYGIALFGSQDGSIKVEYNRLVDNADGIIYPGSIIHVFPKGLENHTSSPVMAEHNWWGCNAGPGGAGCMSTVEGPVDYSPWLILSVNGDPARLPTAGRTNVNFDLRHDSSGAPISEPALLPPMAIAVSKTSGPGSFLSPPTELEQGFASAPFETRELGEARVSAKVDEQTSENSLVFGLPPVPPTQTTSVQARLSISKVVVSPDVWALGRSLPKFSRRIPVGTKISFRLSAPATARLVFERVVYGQKRAKRCVPSPRPEHGRGRRCKRLVKAGSLAIKARVGLNRLRFGGRLSRRRTLKPGRYALTISARDSQGHRVQSKRVRFTIVSARG